MRRIAAAVVCIASCSSLLAAAHQRVAIQNWSVPPLHAVANAAISGRAAFIAVDPCRVADTRNANGSYGGPKLVGGTSRTFNIPAGPCTGIPTSAAAYSLNFTVLNGEGASGFLTAYPTGSTRPTVSTLNYGLGNLVANAALVPAGTSASIDVYVNYNADLIIDINGYFTEPVITGVTAGTGLAGGGTSGTVTVGIDTSGAASGQALSYNGTTTTWSNVTNGVTAGTGLSGGAASGPATLSVNFAGSGSATTAARSDHSHYARTVIVNSGGSATANGTALLNALAGITTASSTNQFLLKLEPGTYDLGTASLTMKQFVDIEGSGEITTAIKNRVSTVILSNSTLIAADNAEVRFLTAECSGGTGSYSTAFFSLNASPSVLHATFKGSGGGQNNYGAYVSGGSPKLNYVTGMATGGSASLGIVTVDATTATVTNSSFSASGASSLNIAIETGQNSVPTFTNVTATAQGGSNFAAGVYNFNGGATLTGVVAIATGGTSNYGLYLDSNSGSYTVRVDRSRFVGSTATVRSITGYTTFIGASQLEGGAVSPGGGTVTCIDSYNGNNANAGGFTACP
jgi:hypothetical protein